MSIVPCRTLVALLLTFTLPSCTFAGLGIGSGIDSLIPGPYEEGPPTISAALRPNQRVRLILNSGVRIEGRYLSMLGPTAQDPHTYLVLKLDDGFARIPSSDIKTLGIEVSGNGWVYGALVGFALDIAIVVALLSYSSQPHNYGGWGGGW